ncbi:MAG: SUMF1/EgtB/PvdO family nonheme iron enzyme [Candidatus Omnitrophica bacterium]|nr:SUMF1/EgtB/PvdO family nonheme iron enzyme [Candidatus Omnitrophota bacterium]MDD5488556.1 SUMF1/EgtB/PvdO family nonheme iron enzyme [Candidatus Omnitrophota bacterium]
MKKRTTYRENERPAAIRMLMAILVFFSVMALFCGAAFANNLEISSGNIVALDTGADTATVQFNISWQNSWRDFDNYDAVWVFIKYSLDGTTWSHATLYASGTNPSGTSVGTGTALEIIVPADRKGCFIQRSWTGTGDVSTSNVNIVWGYGLDGISDAWVENIDIRIIGIEMVYVPQGSFFAGDYQTSTAAFDQGSAVAETDPWYISGEAAVVVQDVSENGFYYNSAGNPGESTTGSSFMITDSFPKGYGAFYAMKYEITEEQWVDFFNTLGEDAKMNRDITGASGKNSDSEVYRNTIGWTEGDAGTERPERACGFLSWMDICAYADWAALRPMSELEFEKAARGKDVTPTVGAYPWGNTAITAASVISGTEDGTETVTNSGANCAYMDVTYSGGDGGSGPLRAGIFATVSSGRQKAGAGYYGCMELSGNLWERCVTVGNNSGRAFQGTHGDGALESASGYEGNATNTDWPGYNDGEGVSDAAGSGMRGGSWAETVTGRMATSDRARAALTSATRDADTGGRCVRTAS